MKIYRFLIALSFVLDAMPSNAQTCPSSITVSTQLAKNVLGWESKTGESIRKFQALNILDESIEREMGTGSGVLIPSHADGAILGSWTFLPIASKSPFIMECRYQETTITLLKKIDNGMTKCVYLKRNKYLEFEGKCYIDKAEKQEKPAK